MIGIELPRPAIQIQAAVEVSDDPDCEGQCEICISIAGVQRHGSLAQLNRLRREFLRIARKPSIAGCTDERVALQGQRICIVRVESHGPVDECKRGVVCLPALALGPQFGPGPHR